MADSIYDARANLQEQVKTKGITQAQADAELARLIGTGYGLNSALTDAKNNLAAQVKSKGITQAQADAELQRLISTGYGKDAAGATGGGAGTGTTGGGGTPPPKSPVPTPTPTELGNYAKYTGAIDPSLHFWAKSNLDYQVGKGWKTQEQANQEYDRLLNMQGVTAPVTDQAILGEQARLAKLVKEGKLSQRDADLQYWDIVRSAQSPYSSPGLNLNDPSQVINTIFDAAKASQMQGNLLTNPNQQGPFGNMQVVIDPVTGQPTIKQSLSSGNQGIVGGLQQGGIGALGSLQNVLGADNSIFNSLSKAAQGKDSSSPMSNFEQAVFDRLTDTLDEERATDTEQLHQTLANRGIPLGSELWNQQTAKLDKRYDDMFQQARDQAVQSGTSNSMQALGALTNVGQAGFFNPNFQPYQSVGYQQPDVGSIWNSWNQYRLGQGGLDIDYQNLAMTQEQWAEQLKKIQQDAANTGGGGGGGGGGRQPTPPNPFNLSGIPGA